METVRKVTVTIICGLINVSSATDSISCFPDRIYEITRATTLN